MRSLTEQIIVQTAKTFAERRRTEELHMMMQNTKYDMTMRSLRMAVNIHYNRYGTQLELGFGPRYDKP